MSSSEVNSVTGGEGVRKREHGRVQNKLRVGMCGGQEVWTHCETNADGGSEGPWDELALVVLNQQGRLAHSAVSHEDRLQERVTERRDIMYPGLQHCRLRPAHCVDSWCKLLYMFICCSEHCSVFCNAM